MIRCQVGFFADTLGVNTSLVVLLPQPALTQIGVAPVVREHGTPVLYLLHGLSDDSSIWTRLTSIERYAGELGVAVVMPQVERSFYCDMANGDAYWTFLSEELPAVVAANFKVSTAREDTFVAGLSMGGYGAFKWALRQPERFGAAASLSGALDVVAMASFQRVPEQALDRLAAEGFTPAIVAGLAAQLGTTPRTLYRYLGQPEGASVTPADGELARAQLGAAAAEGKRRLALLRSIWGGRSPAGTDDDLLALLDRADPAALPPLFLTCGTEDDLREDNEAFVARARQRGVELEAQFHPGSHEWAYWDARIQDVLAWLPLR